MNKEKIEEATQKYIHSEYHGTIAYEWDVLYDKADIKAKAKKKYFEAGALWAIQEYKKSLWHDASEEPDFKRPIVFTGKMFFNHIDSLNCPNKEDLDDIKNYYGEFKWCYSKDIFPNDYYKE